MSADFRLEDPQEYEAWYGEPHAAPEWLSKFVYGLPELHREELQGAHYVSGVGCNATAANLALLPLIKAGLLELDQPVIVEIKAGSSEGGVQGNPGSHHPERSGVVRTFSAFGHRHTAEVIQEMGVSQPILTMTSVDLVRGVLDALGVRGRFRDIFDIAFGLYHPKPSPLFYRRVVAHLALPPEQVAFVDDNPRNLPPALELEMHCIYLGEGEAPVGAAHARTFAEVPALLREWGRRGC